VKESQFQGLVHPGFILGPTLPGLLHVMKALRAFVDIHDSDHSSFGQKLFRSGISRQRVNIHRSRQAHRNRSHQ
jgi:hypothetical protein